MYCTHQPLPAPQRPLIVNVRCNMECMPGAILYLISVSDARKGGRGKEERGKGGLGGIGST